MKKPDKFDVVIVGSGAAGLALALRLKRDLRVALLSKARLRDGSTYYAQGGVSVVMDEDDSFESHIEDTINAGAGLCNEATVRQVVERGPTAIDRLIHHGVDFSRFIKASGEEVYHLTREGGHSHRRVIHAADATGKAIEKTLEAKVRERANITVLEQHIAVDLITGTKLGEADPRVRGLYVLDRESGQVEALAADAVVIATGGASKAYLYTSNPDISTGDGIAMAWRAGCRVANMEFIQFHPTCLYHPEAKTLLITEAVRGEGGHLLLPDGTRFMDRFDERAELAPRDIVARAIDHEMKRLGAEHLLLDISHRDEAFILEHFPNINRRLLKYGIDMTREPVPVVPAAHYTCGGIMVDLTGRTDLPGLYAIGEASFTGLHGANRMASNSLLECLVFADAAAEDIDARLPMDSPGRPLPPWDESRVTDSDEMVVVSHNWDELRRFMWDYVGIVRSTKRLERAKHRVDMLLGEIADYYGNFRVSNDLLELRNLAQVAELIIRSAMERKESRGLHYTLDHPQLDEGRVPRDTVLVPNNFADGRAPRAW
ncbi:MAG: L-aspartate oxidase [Gammaproteobacteria bacterium]